MKRRERTSPRISQDMLPHRIGRYDVSAELGRGSTSIVYKGIDPVAGRVVAIKTLQRSSADADGDAETILLRFRNEAHTIGRLHHPGIVAVDEFGEDGLHSWIAMEYVEGSNLDDVLVRNPLLGQERAVAIMDELLDALGCVHREGICHRDLKPANIMVTPAGRVKLTDFGVARLRDLGLTRVSSIIGTPAFMAPEQFTGGALDHRADLFACGVLLFLLLSGRRPFSGAPAAVMHQILHEEPPLLCEASGGSVGRAYDDVISRALAKRADERFSSADDMRDALRAAALRAADATLVTMIGTVVQDAGRPYGTPAGDEPRPPRPADERIAVERAPAHLVLRAVRGHAELVDALALYAPDANQRQALLESLPTADAQSMQATGTAAGDQSLFPEMCNSVQHLLARRLGPVANVLVKRAADTAGASRSAFITNLLAEMPAPHRAEFRAELDALLPSLQRTELGR
jgi:tRNA A-37 threonylcarbamoyl transferase component Bud32